MGIYAHLTVVEELSKNSNSELTSKDGGFTIHSLGIAQATLINLMQPG